jgi:hypothetical protein
MYIDVKHENSGYAVATYGDYVVVSNPSVTKYDVLTSSLYRTGSVDYFRYNKSTDEHDYIGSFYKHPIDIDVLLTTESINLGGMETEINGTYANDGILIDKDLYTASVDNGYGLSLDMYNKMLVVGSPYYTQYVQTYAKTIVTTGASIDIYDLNLTEFTNDSSSAYVYTIEDPDILLPTTITGSFGTSVSINNEWIAVGSPFVSSSNGMVYMYRNISTGSNYSWSLYQKINPENAIVGAEFGYSLKLNKSTGSYSSSMVIGCGNDVSNAAYYYQLIDNVWTQTFIFKPDYTIKPMTFSDYMPHLPTMNTTNGFGKAVSIYGNSVIIGEYLDRSFYEFDGSTQYQQGSVYIFEKCINPPYTTVPNALFSQVFKSYGTSLTLKNNRMGFSVDIFGDNAVAGIPKTNIFNLTSCYVGGTLEQLHNSDIQSLLTGQTMLIQKNTSSYEWEITNVYQKKKKFLSPYRSYGFDVAIADRSMVVGAPIYLNDSNRQLNINITQSGNVVLDDVSGKSYIYNLKNLRDEFHVGNVFYRNGKIIIMTSGSAFDELFFNPINVDNYEYDLQFKGQHTIFEKQIICSINPGEFNVSTNPSSLVFQTSSLDVNKNGTFDFQDLDVVMRYMQYKNTSLLGVPISTDWSSSVVITDDEMSLLNWYQSSNDYSNTSLLTSESIFRWETSDIWMQNLLDFNEDNKIDVNDINIMWKYFTNRLNQKNYTTYITPSCKRKLFSDVIDYMGNITKKNSIPSINSQFFNYEHNSELDKTGSFLAPMVTTIGLYSGLDVVAIAKLGTPIKLTPELPYNFVVKMDF